MSPGRFAVDYLSYSPSSTVDRVSNVTTAVVGITIGIMLLGLLYFVIKAYWHVYRKAGQRPWTILVPFYNSWVWAKIAGRPGWWGLLAVLLSAIPLIGWILPIIMAVDVAKRFGRSSPFGVVWLWFFSLVGVVILGYGQSTYRGEIVAAAVPTPPTPPAPTPDNSTMFTTPPETPMPSASMSDSATASTATEPAAPVAKPTGESPAPITPERPMLTPPVSGDSEPQGPPPPPASSVQ